ncbi:MAG TPA: DUF3857 domain-containing protein [Phnomibacter sp.]|nr:DUF3857 domain-containing protein [Phnomibacter sp.]
MKTIGNWIVLMLLVLQAQAQQFAVKLIPDSLLKGADVVVRVDEMKLEIADKGKAHFRTRIAYTILNEKADYLSIQQNGYDKFISIDNIDANLYDADGNKIKSLRKSDIKDLSDMGGGTDISDDRIKEYGFYHKTYPYTVEFEVSTTYKGLMFLPTWYALSNERISVEQTSYSVTYPGDAPVQFKAFNYPGEPKRSAQGNNTTLVWEMKNLKALLKEPLAPAWHEITPVVFLAMKDFMMDGYTGSNASWEKLGDFVYQLKKGRDVLPYEIQGKVKEMVAGKQTTFEKVDALYKFMQSNTRYISIQLGIGGWQPYDASYVYTKKYGYCKALTNYMAALLNAVEIPSVYALVKAGSGQLRFMEDFPSSQFNHVILCVPNGNDSIWLECTSQTMPTGYLGDFTNNRPVLMVKETGSRLGRTPDYSIDQNLQLRRIQATVNADGTLTCTANNEYRAMQQDDLHGLINAYPLDKQKEVLQQQFNLGTYSVKSFKYTELSSKLPVIEEKLELEALNYAQISGKRLMLQPNILSRSNWRLQKDSTRKFDFLFSYPYTDVDSVQIEVGEGYTVEALPRPQKIENEFGYFETRTELVGSKVLYYRKIQRKAGQFPPAKWESLVKYLDDITRADRQKIVLVKKEA